MKKNTPNTDTAESSKGNIKERNYLPNKNSVLERNIPPDEEKIKIKGKNSKKENYQDIINNLLIREVELEKQNKELSLSKSSLLESNKNLAELFDRAPIGCFILNINDIITNVNLTGSNMLGIAKEQLIGESLSTFLGSNACKDNYNKHRNLVINSEKLQEVECKIKRKDGSVYFAIMESIIVRDDNNNFKYFHTTLSDISVRKEQESKIELSLVKEKELNEMKSQFISMASHEFRTPLMAILSSTNLLEKYKSPEDDEKRAKHYYKIKSSVNGLKEILTEFLSLNQIEKGMIKNEPEPFNLVDFTKDLLDEINNETHTFNYENTGKNVNVELDPKLLKICLTNIIGNSIKYSPSGSIIEIKTELNTPGLIKISVKDAGIGIPENDKIHIFEQFFRAKNAEIFQGTGLGLNMIQKLIAIMGGSIEFESMEGEGTTFLLTF